MEGSSHLYDPFTEDIKNPREHYLMIIAANKRYYEELLKKQSKTRN